MNQYIEVRRRHDPDDAPPLAVVYPPDRVEGTDDPAVLGDIRAALNDSTVLSSPPLPPFGWPCRLWLPTAPKGLDPHTLNWAIAVHIALSRRGYRCRSYGYNTQSNPQCWQGRL